MKRLALIEPLLEDSIYIVDGKSWLAMAKRIAEENGTTRKRILGLYYKYLARLVLMEKGGRERGKDRDVRNFDWAIRKFYFSAKKMSLRDTYDHMLASRYMTPDGKLMEVVLHGTALNIITTGMDTASPSSAVSPGEGSPITRGMSGHCMAPP